VILDQRATYTGPERAICHHRPATILRRVAHLLWLPRFDLVRPYQLRTVRPVGLGWVASGGRTLGYSALEHFLGDLEALRVAAPLGDALARRYLQVWPVPADGAFFYLDPRRKVHYSGDAIAAGKVSATERVQGAITQLFLHDAAGHGLHMQSGPGDDHLTRTVRPFLHRVRPLIGRERVRAIVADQEMRSVALFQALDTEDHLGFVTLGRTPTPAQEASYQVEGLFLPYRRDPATQAITHWIAHAHRQLHDPRQGVSFLAEVSLVLDCRAGLPGRLIPVLHNLRAAHVPVEQPHQTYVGRWQGQERVFRDMRAGQNLDANYGQKKVLASNRTQERRRAALQQQLQTWTQRIGTAQRQVQEYTTRLATQEQQAQRRHAQQVDQIGAWQQERQHAATPARRARLHVRIARWEAQDQIQQVRWQERRRRLTAHLDTWRQKLAERQQQHVQTTQALQELDDRPRFDLDLEKDDLMTYLRIAGENTHRFVQEHYFADTRFASVDEATMIRVIYNQPGWVRREGRYLRVQLQGYRDAEVQAAVVQACQRVNQARIQLPGGRRLHMEVAPKVLNC